MKQLLTLTPHKLLGVTTHINKFDADWPLAAMAPKCGGQMTSSTDSFFVNLSFRNMVKYSGKESQTQYCI